LDDPLARAFLLQADQLMSALYEAVAQPGGPSQVSSRRDHVTDLMSGLRQAYEPLLARFPPDYQARVRALG
jgi:hypothetical protein